MMARIGSRIWRSKLGIVTLWSRFRSWCIATLRRARMESEMEAELRSHIEIFAEDLIRTGMPRQEALRRARIEFGGIERAKEECQDARATRLMDGLRVDIRFALRNLRKHALLSASVVITLALGLGVSTAVFTLVDATALRARVDRDPDSFVRVYSTYTTDPANLGQPGSTTLEDDGSLGARWGSLTLWSLLDPLVQFDR